jgi:hypothetical protein
MANITGDMTFDMTGDMTGDMIPSTGDSAPTQWGDFPSNVSELPPSYVLVDSETDSYPHDYTGESNENVLTEDDGNEVSGTTTGVRTDHYVILAGWCESNLSSPALPVSSGSDDFLQSDVNNTSDFINYVTAYGEITPSNTPTIANDSIVIRMKYSGTAPVNLGTRVALNDHTSNTDTNFTITTSFADYTITGVSFSSSLIDARGGFYIRFRILTTGTTTLHIDKIALVA